MTQKNLIAGEWQTGSGEIENHNPSDLTDLVGVYAQATSDQLSATLEQAHRAQREWAAYGIERKQAVLMNIGNEMMSRAEELGTLLSREEGKPLAEGKGEDEKIYSGDSKRYETEDTRSKSGYQYSGRSGNPKAFNP